MASPFDDNFIATHRKNIGAIFDMIRVLAGRQSATERELAKELKDLKERVYRIELLEYGASEELKAGVARDA